VLRFLDGPASSPGTPGLMARRAPLYLRVTRNRLTDKWDVLDQLDDEAHQDEELWAYRRSGYPGFCFVDWTDDRGRRKGGASVSADYVIVDEQPHDHVMRNNKLWQAWCVEQQKKAKVKP
jgi:hypothetical protein